MQQNTVETNLWERKSSKQRVDLSGYSHRLILTTPMVHCYS